MLLNEYGPQTREQLASHYEQVTLEVVDTGLADLAQEGEAVESSGVWRLAELD